MIAQTRRTRPVEIDRNCGAAKPRVVPQPRLKYTLVRAQIEGQNGVVHFAWRRIGP